MNRISFKTFFLFFCYLISTNLQSAATKRRRLNLPIPIEIIEADDIDAAQKAIEQGYDVNAKYPVGTLIITSAPITDAIDNTPLIIAIVLNKLNMVEFLLAKGADVNMRGYCNKTPLWNAIRYFYNSYIDYRIDPKIIDLLLDHNDFDLVQLHNNKTYLERACDEETEDPYSRDDEFQFCLIPKILGKIAKKKSKKEYFKEISNVLQKESHHLPQPKFIKYLLEKGAMLKFDRSLYSNEGSFAEAKKIYQEFLDSKKDLINELLQCVQEKNDKRIEEILQNYPMFINEQNEMGETVLLNAILFGRFDLIKKFFDGDSIFIKPDLLIDQNENGKFGPNNPVQNAIDLRRRVYDTATLDQIISYLKSKRLDQQILVEVKKSIKLPEEAIDLVTDYLYKLNI